MVGKIMVMELTQLDLKDWLVDFVIALGISLPLVLTVIGGVRQRAIYLQPGFESWTIIVIF